MATSFNDLPQELCNDIVRFFKYDRKSLVQLCLASIRFVDEAQSYLYAQLTRNTMPLNSARSSKLLSTLTVHNPSLAKYVKTFCYDIRLLKHDPVYKVLRRALCLMVNITWLEINTKIPYSPQGFFHGCTFQLKHFRCQFASSDRKAIYKMLSRQRSLQSVYIDNFDGDFPSKCCRKIKRLVVEDWRNVVQILPGRSIFALELLHVEPFFDSIPPSITTQLGDLTHLTFKTETPYDFLETVAPYLIRLTMLRIIGRDDETPSGMSIGEDPEILYKLSNLKIFVWSLEIDYDLNSGLTEADELYQLFWDLVKVWFQGMPKLEAVYTLDRGSWHTGFPYFHWTQNMSSKRVEAKVALGRKSLYTK
ncbi:hypothetical protein AGABI1DRAFT_127246 [Agaricus bisporus var. burnettii JB137-S8]|uniref:F-box domain-containing protein n=1 Tax=Agaricus bisporus var. burnettii (strain JB137-S8 / ATCC MYA-4627 / FGSC 10392) TaxID=597362 RepID=K5Y0G0_AGABU|nr:uncharacterized protein AGABI1DRAFT_127246 [Agaricus bisporus var. burnettii JB137-S8]EKM81230.1 hypothetical protein AGABI1DRAFT_127246 [Agaricus bisporus var. burnettii JB137-S8]